MCSRKQKFICDLTTTTPLDGPFLKIVCIVPQQSENSMKYLGISAETILYVAITSNPRKRKQRVIPLFTVELF